MWELTKTFRFEAAHTLHRNVDTDASRRVHGHSYRAVIAVRGAPDATTGMLIDLGLLEHHMAQTRAALDHRLLDDIEGLGQPTLENLSAWIWQRLHPATPGLARVTLHRDSLDESCAYTGPEAAA